MFHYVSVIAKRIRAARNNIGRREMLMVRRYTREYIRVLWIRIYGSIEGDHGVLVNDGDIFSILCVRLVHVPVGFWHIIPVKSKRDYRNHSTITFVASIFCKMICYGQSKASTSATTNGKELGRITTI